MDTGAPIGAWIKARRRELDLTQEALAEQAGCSVDTVRKIEAGTARPSRQLAELLASSLGVPPTEQPAFVRWARAELPSRAAPVTAAAPTAPAPSNLPASPTPLIGREDELATITALLQEKDVRLLTLTGPGGSGKTRLAIEAARHLERSFPAGVVFVPLAPVQDPDLILSTIAAGLDVREAEGRPLPASLRAYLRDKQLLLVLDNFEHLISAAREVAELLANTTEPKILVTSRAALHVRGEREFPVPPLALPKPATGGKDEQSVAAVEQYSAIRLFVARARDVRPGFALTEENGATIAAICRRLDGLPLAIELAAARIRSLPPATLLARLDRQLAVLTGGARDLPARQQTLRGTISWSYDLLTPAEQTLFRRLAVFAGGCSLEAAELVCGDDESDPSTDSLQSSSLIPRSFVLDGLDSLVDKNLPQQSEDAAGEARFGMLETIREYALEQLAASGEAAEVRDRHRDWCLALAEAAAPHLRGSEQRVWMDRLEQEHDNLRAALDWCEATDDGAGAGLRLAAALWEFWWVRGYWTEGRARLEAVLARSPEPTPARAQALLAAGALRFMSGDLEGAALQAVESRRLFQEVGDLGGLAMAVIFLGLLAEHYGDKATARTYFEESLALRKQLGDRAAVADSISSLGSTAQRAGDYATAIRLYKESLTLQRELGDKPSMASTLQELGNVALLQEDYDQARQLLQESLALAQELQVTHERAWILGYLGLVYLQSGDEPQAVKVLEESLAVAQELNNTLLVAMVLEFQGDVAMGRQGELEQARTLFTRSLALGRDMKDPYAIIIRLEKLANLEAREGNAQRAARLFGAAEAAREALSLPRPPSMRTYCAPGWAAARAALGDAAFDACWNAGRAMSLDAAVAYALDERISVDDPTP